MNELQKQLMRKLRRKIPRELEAQRVPAGLALAARVLKHGHMRQISEGLQLHVARKTISSNTALRIATAAHRELLNQILEFKPDLWESAMLNPRKFKIPIKAIPREYILNISPVEGMRFKQVKINSSSGNCRIEIAEKRRRNK